jgi:hypothetical protein
MAAHHPTELARRVLRTPGLGHEDAFPRPRLSVRCRFSQRAFVGTWGNGQDAPIAVVRTNANRAPGSTRSLRRLHRELIKGIPAGAASD